MAIINTRNPLDKRGMGLILDENNLSVNKGKPIRFSILQNEVDISRFLPKPTFKSTLRDKPLATGVNFIPLKTCLEPIVEGLNLLFHSSAGLQTHVLYSVSLRETVLFLSGASLHPLRDNADNK
jgi:hypothetical protein